MTQGSVVQEIMGIDFVERLRDSEPRTVSRAHRAVASARRSAGELFVMDRQRHQERLTITLWDSQTETSLTCAEVNPFDGIDGANAKLRYLWSDGSYGCDCNRRLLWIRHVEGREPDLEEGSCGHERYRARIVTADGRTVLFELRSRSRK